MRPKSRSDESAGRLFYLPRRMTSAKSFRVADENENKNPDEITEAVEKKEFKNLLAAIQDGHIPTRDNRDRLKQLAISLCRKGDESAIEAAVKAGAFNIDKKKRKANKAETEERTEQFLHWLRVGKSRAEMWHLAAVTWGLSVRQSCRYLEKAMTVQAKFLEKNRHKLEGLFLLRLDEAYQFAKSRGNATAMVSATDVASRITNVQRPATQRFEFAPANSAPKPLISLPDKSDAPASDAIDV